MSSSVIDIDEENSREYPRALDSRVWAPDTVWLERRSPLLLPFELPSQGNSPWQNGRSDVGGNTIAECGDGEYGRGMSDDIGHKRRSDKRHYDTATRRHFDTTTGMSEYNSDAMDER